MAEHFALNYYVLTMRKGQYYFVKSILIEECDYGKIIDK